MLNLINLVTDDHLGAAWHGYLLVSTAGGVLLRMVWPGRGRHRRPRG